VTDADLSQLRSILVEIKKGLTTASFNRHRADLFEGYIAPAHRLLSAFFKAHGGVCELKLEVSTFTVGDASLMEDDSQDANIIYPLWAAGMRLLIFKEGIEALDLLRFFMSVTDFKKSRSSDDLLTFLWTQQIKGVDWLVVTDVDFDDEGTNRRQAAIETKLRADPSGFPRVAVADLEQKLEQLEQIRRTVPSKEPVAGVDARSAPAEALADERDLLRRICNILLEVMKLEASPRELSNLEQALEQLLDGLLFEGQFGMVNRLLQQCSVMAAEPSLPLANREMARGCGERLFTLMQEEQRVRAVGAAINAGRVKDAQELRRYLVHLGSSVIPLLLDVLEMLNTQAHRRAINDVLVETGPQSVPVFAERLPTASPNLAKDLLYIVDKINPADKAQVLAPFLKHENAVLRMEVLTTIGRTKDTHCFDVLREVFETHEVPQMRAHAARVLAEYPPDWAEPLLLNIVKGGKFDAMADGEKRALIGALVKVESPAAQGWVRALFAEKSGLLTGRKIEDKKRMAISALRAAPGMPALQLLVEVAKDDKQHSKEVRDAAHEAALEVNKRLLGPPAAAPSPASATSARRTQDNKTTGAPLIFAQDDTPLTGRRAQLQAFGRQAIGTLHSLIRDVPLDDVDSAIFHQPFQLLRECINAVIAVDGRFDLAAAGTVLALNGIVIAVDLSSLGNVRALTNALKSRDVGGLQASRPVQQEELKIFLRAFAVQNTSMESVDGLMNVKVIKYRTVVDMLQKRSELEIAQHRKIDRTQHAFSVYARGVTYLNRFIEGVTAQEDQRPMNAPALRLVRELVDICLEHKGVPERNIFLGMARTREPREYLPYHSVNTCLLAIVVGTELGLAREPVFNLGRAALFHDVGAAGADAAVLNKVGALSTHERNVVAQNPYIAAKMMLKPRPLDLGALRCIVVAAEAKQPYFRIETDAASGKTRWHLQSLGVFGRIIRVCSTYDALTSSRPYREAFAPAAAIAMMCTQMKHEFDPHLLATFVKVLAGASEHH
jgi:HD-GYP domain-containing protein (c-di-GMP phosphodiesterase class II)